MNCNLFDSSNPYFWIFLSAIFFGAATGKSTVSCKKKENSEKAKTIKWTLVYLYLSLSIIFVLAAVFIPGAHRFKDIRLLYFFAAISLLFALGFRFKKTCGIILIILLFGLFIGKLFILQGWSCLKTTGEVMSFRLLAKHDGVMKLEITDPKNDSIFINVEGDTFTPAFHVLRLESYYFFVEGHLLYSFDPPRLSKRLLIWLKKNNGKIPG
ncbi:MAG: hypothetical protein AB1798_16790, partial [Spirochaetota bacterium]